jgi:hypothetical protein
VGGLDPARGRAEVEPRLEEFTGDDDAALALVESNNALRRNLAGSQRAMVAARRWGLNGHSKGGAGTHKRNQPSPGATVGVKELARRYHVSDNSIRQARDLLAEAADLATLPTW